jgi:CRP-like cAMP-binding protein
MTWDISNIGGIAAIVAGLLLVVAIASTSMRGLRVLALLAGGVSLFAVVAMGADGFVTTLVAAFVIVNALQLLRLLLRRRRHHLSAEERDLLEGVLQVQDLEQQRRLVGLMRWRDAEVDEVLMEQGDSRPALIYIASGEAAIEHDGKIVGQCGDGDFLGEFAMMTGESASATVRVTREIRMARFDRSALAQFTAGVPELQRAFDAALNRGMAAKILRMNKAAASSTD